MSDLREEKRLVLLEDGTCELEVDRIKGSGSSARRRKMERKSVRTSVLMPSVGQTMVLPTGCRMYRVHRDTSVFVIEQHPQVRTVEWGYVKSNWWGSLVSRGCLRKYGLTEKADRDRRVFDLAFPFLVFVVSISGKFAKDLMVFYRTEPLGSENDYLMWPCTTNLHSSGKMCMPIPAAAAGDTHSQHADKIVDRYWGSRFNQDLPDTFNRMRQGKPQLRTIWDWEFHSRTNPLWPLGVRWTKFSRNIGQVMDQFVARDASLRDLDRGIFKMFFQRVQSADASGANVEGESKNGLIVSHSPSVLFDNALVGVGDLLVATQAVRSKIKRGAELTLLHFYEPDPRGQRFAQFEGVEDPILIGQTNLSGFKVKTSERAEQTFDIGGYVVQRGSKFMLTKRSEYLTGLRTGTEIEIEEVIVDRDGDLSVRISGYREVYYLSFDGGQMLPEVEFIRPRINGNTFIFSDNRLKVGATIRVSSRNMPFEGMILRVAGFRQDDEDTEKYHVSFEGLDGEFDIFSDGAMQISWNEVSIDYRDEMIVTDVAGPERRLRVGECIRYRDGSKYRVSRVVGFENPQDAAAHPFDINVKLEGLDASVPVVAKSKWVISYQLIDVEINEDKIDFWNESMRAGQVVRFKSGERAGQLAIIKQFVSATRQGAHLFDTDIIFEGLRIRYPLIKESKWVSNLKIEDIEITDSKIVYSRTTLEVGQVVRIKSGDHKGFVGCVEALDRSKRKGAHLLDVDVRFTGIDKPVPVFQNSKWQLTYETVRYELTDDKVTLGEHEFQLKGWDHVMVTDTSAPLPFGGVYKTLAVIPSERDDAHPIDIDMVLENVNGPIAVIRHSQWVLPSFIPVSRQFTAKKSIKLEVGTLIRSQMGHRTNGMGSNEVHEIHCFVPSAEDPNFTEVIFKDGMAMPVCRESFRRLEYKSARAKSFREFSDNQLKALPSGGAASSRSGFRRGDKVTMVLEYATDNGCMVKCMRGNVGTVTYVHDSGWNTFYDVQFERPVRTGNSRQTAEVRSSRLKHWSIDKKLKMRFGAFGQKPVAIRYGNGLIKPCPAGLQLQPNPQGKVVGKDKFKQDLRVGDVVKVHRVYRQSCRGKAANGKLGVVLRYTAGGGYDAHWSDSPEVPKGVYVDFGCDIGGGEFTTKWAGARGLDQVYRIGDRKKHVAFVKLQECERLEAVVIDADAEPQVAVGAQVVVRPGVKPSEGWAGVKPSEVGTVSDIDGDDVEVDFPGNTEWIGQVAELEVYTKSLKTGDKVRIKDALVPRYGRGNVDNGETGVVKKATGDILKVNFPSQKGWNADPDDLEVVSRKAS